MTPQIHTPVRGPEGGAFTHPYGFRVHYEAKINGRLVQKWFRSKSTFSHAQGVARFKEGFVRIIRLEPFTREEWDRTFGEVQKV